MTSAAAISPSGADLLRPFRVDRLFRRTSLPGRRIAYPPVFAAPQVRALIGTPTRITGATSPNYLGDEIITARRMLFGVVGERPSADLTEAPQTIS